MLQLQLFIYFFLIAYFAIQPQSPSVEFAFASVQQRKYQFLKTVKSVDELDRIRFENNCVLFAGKPSQILKPIKMPRSRKRSGKVCDFELRACPNFRNGHIHIYAHSHPLLSEEKRSRHIRGKELMLDANPPAIYRTADTTEWNFIQTLPDYDQMQEFRQKKQCSSKSSSLDKRAWRIRFYCSRRCYPTCKFMLLALKTTKEGYHVYKHGKHNHTVSQSSSNERQQSRKGEGNEEETSEDGEDDDDDDEEEEKEKLPPRSITKNIPQSQIRKYRFLNTVKTLEELDKLRFQNYCHFIRGKPQQILKSCIIPCTRKKFGKNKCDFELMALPSPAENGDIHVYAHSQHNHLFISEEKRAIIRRERELMSDANPPRIFCTPDNIQWKFLQTLPDYDKLQKFIGQNKYNTPRLDEKRGRIRFYCYRRNSHHNCKFIMMAMKTVKEGYHAYTHGKHNHPAIKPIGEDKRDKGTEEMEEEDEEDEEKDSEDEVDQAAEGSLQVDGIEYPLEKCKRRLNSSLRRGQVQKTKKWMRRIDATEIGQVITDMHVKNMTKLVGMANNDIGICKIRVKFWHPWINQVIQKRRVEPNVPKQRSMSRQNANDDEEEEKESQEKDQQNEVVGQQKPSRKITKKTRGQIREYHFIKTVNSVKELDKIRVKNYCQFNGLNMEQKRAFTSQILPCTGKKRSGNGCDFELRAVRPNLKSRKIHIYAYSKHNHSIISKQEKILLIKEKELMPDANPPAIFRTEDNIEWTFFQTIPDYTKMDKFRYKNQCLSRKSKVLDEKSWRIRFACQRKRRHNCEFMLLAMKTAKKGYHVYKHGEHNHPLSKQRKSQYINQQEQMENEEEEEEEVEEADENDGEDIPIQIPIEEGQQEEEEQEGSMEIEVTGQNENTLGNANQLCCHKPKEIHEFFNVGAWLRRKR